MSLQACADLVARGDPDRFAAAMAAPPAARAILFPLYAFNLEVARAPWLTAEPMIAEMRLQWWRDVLDEIASGGPLRRHEVATPLAQAIDAEVARALAGLIEARRWDIDGRGFEDDAALAAYLDATAGTLTWASAQLLGAPADVERPIRDFAYGAGLAAWFRAIPELEARGRHPLPDGRPGAVQTLARAGLRRIARARASRHAIPPAAGPALYQGWQSAALLRRAAANPGRVAEGRLGLSPFRSRLLLLTTAVTGRW